MKGRPRSPRWPARIAEPPRQVRATALAAIIAAASVGCGSAVVSTSAGPTAPTVSRSRSASPTFTAFVGQWDGHGSYLDIHSNGSFTMSARTYRICGQDPPPCDTFSGNTITDGDVATGQLTSVSGEVATGEVTHTTDSADSPAGPITMTLDPATDTISAHNVSFCGPSAPAGNCGALHVPGSRSAGESDQRVRQLWNAGLRQP
jgi:hypothetical protein